MGQPRITSGLRWAALLLIAIPLPILCGLFAIRWLCSAQEESVAPPPSVPPATALFRDWPNKRPDIVLMLTGEEHGYLQPCGCSRPQLGGLARRYNFLHSLRDRGWPVIALDLGDMFDDPKHRGPQAALKYRTSMEALNLMGYNGVALGQYETASPTLLDTLVEYALNYPTPPVMAANLLNKSDKDNPEDNFLGAVKSGLVTSGTNGMPRVGVIAIMGPSVVKQVPQQKPAPQFSKTTEELPVELRKLQPQKPDLLVLLYQGSAAEAKACALKFPQFHVILCLTAESEPSDRAERVGDTLIIGVGHKGRYVGVVGAFKTNRPKQPFEFHYQLAALGEDFETPEGKSNPVMELMEKYAETVKHGNYLAKYPQRKHPLQVEYPEATYIGSQACQKCHEHAYAIWKKTPHAHAYHSLETAKHPAQRQYDGECVVCHVVGFGYLGGFTDEAKTPKLKNVGCESCHGPGSLHASGNRQAKMLALMNPFKPKSGESPDEASKRQFLVDQSCQHCHDQDNDVQWDFKKKWPKIAHPEPIEE
jgi:hypothetical protein